MDLDGEMGEFTGDFMEFCLSLNKILENNNIKEIEF